MPQNFSPFIFRLLQYFLDFPLFNQLISSIFLPTIWIDILNLNLDPSKLISCTNHDSMLMVSCPEIPPSYARVLHKFATVKAAPTLVP